LTRNDFGKGSGWYDGTVIKEPTFYDRLVAALLKEASIRPIVHLPAGVEVSVRSNGERRLLFLLNHMQEPRVVELPAAMHDLLGGARTDKTLTLPRLGVAVLEE
jgi:beta-galactosidase